MAEPLPAPDSGATARHLREIEERGYTVLERVIEPDLIEALQGTLERIARERGIGTCTNEFEGRETVRIYNLLACDDVFARVPVHPAVLPVVEGVLDDGCLVSSLSSIDIGPGETPQPIHTDDMVIALPRPHPPLVCNTMWALTDFTEENGATRLVPGSHRFPGYPDLRSDHPSVAAEMPAGSVLVWEGSLWHGGGANRTASRRVGIAMNYCAGYVRQQENQQLGIPVETVRRFPERLQRMVGYGVYRSLIGHIDKQDPRMLLGGAASLRAVWDE
jgi:ectoine hydroxylase-related dioxygenase (phytanoyl-CoA dioxygenase family)